MAEQSGRRPNIILINCDDLGYGDLGCYGSTVNDTPHLDRLAGEGARFTDFYMASSICTPSRAALMTGCYPQRISMNRVLHPGDTDGLHADETTIASVLKGAGYATKIVGKWHLGDQPEFLPTRFGFDSYFGIPFSNDMGRQIGDSPERPPLPLMCDEEVLQQQPDQASITERYVNEGVRFIRDNRQQPFFLYFANMYVHVPLYVPESFMKASRNGRYGAAVACIDWAWGVLDQELERLGLTDDTIVIFTSDNGSRVRGEGGSNAPFRGTKFTTWEGGFRLPLIMRWPQRIPAHTTYTELTASMDLLPTLASLAGADFSPELPVDGVDFSARLLGDQRGSAREHFCYFSKGNLAAVRTGRWKRHFCRGVGKGFHFSSVDELYDLQNDPGESENLFDQYPDIVKEVDAIAAAVREELGDVQTEAGGKSVRACGKVEAAHTLTQYDPDHPYVVAEYDLRDRG